MDAKPSADVLVQSFKAAIAAADPLQIVAAHLPRETFRRIVVVGAGKAAAAMAVAVERAWPERVLEGLVITRYAHGLATQQIRVLEAGHPVPDEAGESGARQILALARSLESSDLLLVLISGGGSSLMTLAAPGLTMVDVQRVNRALLRSGAPITEMNVVRKHLSSISGGQLAAATPARVFALIISDVTGDDPSAIASGPCAPDASTFADARSILERYGIDAPKAVRDYLTRGVEGLIVETPKPGDSIFERVQNRVIATAHQSLVAAADWWTARGVKAVVLGDTVTGEAREVAKVYAALTREIVRYGQPFSAPVALISGGECTVTIPERNVAHGRGGRCSEFLLALAVELNGMPGVSALACDTDGIDGSEDNAGAVLYPDSIVRARSKGLDAVGQLDANDAWGFFAAVDGLVVTGPTRTNVNDYRVILIEPSAFANH